MKSKMIMLSKGLFSFLLLFVTIQETHAQDAPKGHLMNVTELTIIPGHDLQFQEGIKAWKNCYLENKGEWKWRVWRKDQGEGSVYVLASNMANWGDMDLTDDSGNKCANLARQMINQHIEKSNNQVTRFLPEVSANVAMEDEVIGVNRFYLNMENGHKFFALIKEVEALVAKAEGSLQHYWYSWQTAGPGTPNYHVVTPFKNYAAMDSHKSVWAIIEASVGKEKRDEMQQVYRSSVKESDYSTYKLMKDISHTGKE
ncbi:hypothetical protein P872_07555 [Rhodonellum psychrophilum GCM71 = DSM 17998]|uniref:NIPSNAP domain-containing protein n=3 Tax=Cytophagaceae TaxID=89373 RepID=U5C1G1_9BACT|nr:hypothetical protein P872_07555 [Rhodonellum psychrophilum GCM71 = DSM 17998]